MMRMGPGAADTALWADLADSAEDADALRLRDGSRVAVLGGGPAGSFFAYFLLEMAGRVDLDLQVSIYEPRDYSRPAPHGCNMCGGIISESLVQHLAMEGINLPPTIVQRGIDSYRLHTDTGSVLIDTPLHEMGIGSVYRGSGPRDSKDMKWESFDGHLLKLAREKGAHVVAERVSEVRLDDGRPQLVVRNGEPQTFDLLAVATGVNAGALKMFEGLDLGYVSPPTTKTFIREYFFGEETIAKTVGSSMHVFLLDFPRLEFAAIIPKGDYVSVCLLGEEIDDELVKSFLADASVRGCFPEGWSFAALSCQCSPRIAVAGATNPFADRIVFVGDCGETRLYKDGIGAAYRTAKAAASTAAFEGVSSESFKKHYAPVLKRIRNDNRVGKVTFLFTRIIQKFKFARRAVVRMTAREQSKVARRRRMSGVLWDMFTGSASYTSVFWRTLHPVFVVRLMWNLGISILPFRRDSHG